MNDVLDPVPLLICKPLIVGLEALGDAAADIRFRLIIDPHGFDPAADDGTFGALDGWFNVARGMPGQGLDMLAGQFLSPGDAAVNVQ
ncbi:hypothetical protein [Micrococcus luteus]|uniref:hypothetical protein n=1 Tax=Micrococcus luteus TaxID=1270 RepID=UPI00288F6D08|nr:hypothetical protein [Micrococcus luteus]MDT1990349.1 hypothetical protein [Micrococcus luteus]